MYEQTTYHLSGETTVPVIPVTDEVPVTEIQSLRKLQPKLQSTRLPEESPWVTVVSAK